MISCFTAFSGFNVGLGFALMIYFGGAEDREGGAVMGRSPVQIPRLVRCGDS